ncbi:hypothetical protein EV647_1048 [Kribbella sp. VKM Ac-2566]|nr:hypothetical protein EV647_1048 [Kribbella sp. VKM Ac-2566]
MLRKASGQFARKLPTVSRPASCQPAAVSLVPNRANRWVPRSSRTYLLPLKTTSPAGTVAPEFWTMPVAWVPPVISIVFPLTRTSRSR